MNFTEKLPKTVYSPIQDFWKKIIEQNKNFLQNKSLLEFGVYKGTSLSNFSSIYDSLNLKKLFYGFDSFKGLPEEKIDLNNPYYWHEGAFAEYGLENLIRNNLPFVNLKVGWFEDTLNDETLNEIKNNEVGFIHIDCDIYTSTIQILEWLIKNNLLVSGTIIMYDDWGGHLDKHVGEYECGQGKAHKEICKKYNLNFNFIECAIISANYHEVCVFQYK